MLAEKPVDIPERADGPRDRLRRRQSSLITGNVRVSGRRTSVRLESEMWSALNEIRRREGITLPALVTRIERSGLASSLTAAIRVYLLIYFRSAATEEGHAAAGHGQERQRAELPTAQG